MSTVSRLNECIRKPFHSFPVVNMAGKVIGMIPKNFIIVLIEHHCWYEHKEVENKQSFLYKSVSERALSVTNKARKKIDDSFAQDHLDSSPQSLPSYARENEEEKSPGLFINIPNNTFKSPTKEGSNQ